MPCNKVFARPRFFYGEHVNRRNVVATCASMLSNLLPNKPFHTKSKPDFKSGETLATYSLFLCSWIAHLAGQRLDLQWCTRSSTLGVRGKRLRYRPFRLLFDLGTKLYKRQPNSLRLCHSLLHLQKYLALHFWMLSLVLTDSQIDPQCNGTWDLHIIRAEYQGLFGVWDVQYTTRDPPTNCRMFRIVMAGSRCWLTWLRPLGAFGTFTSKPLSLSGRTPPFSLLILQFFPEKSIFTLLWILPLPQLTCQSRGQISSSMRRWGWLVLQRKDWQSKKAQNRICFTAGRTCYVWFIKGPSGMQGSPCKVVFPQTVQTLNGILLDLCCPITWLALPFLGLETSKNLELEQLKAPPLRSDKLVAVIVILSVFISIGRSVFSLVVSQDLVGIHEWRCSSPGFAFKAWWSPPITTMYFTTTIF